MSSTTESLAVEKLDNDNYSVWSVKMKYFLVSKDMWSAVEGNAANAEKDAKALAMIGLSVKNHHLPTINECKTAKEAWEKLSAMFKAATTTRLIKLLRELNGLQKETGETMAMYINRSKSLMHELLDVGHDVKPKEMASRLLAGLPVEFDTLVTILEGQEVLDLDVVVMRLMEVAAKNEKARSSVDNVSAFFAKKGGNDKKSDDNRRCWVCGEKGHISRDCKDKKGDDNASRRPKAISLVAL